MQLTEEQIISFQKLYKEELAIEITKAEAVEKSSALIRYLKLPTIPMNGESACQSISI